MAEAVDVGMERADLKRLLIRSKREPVNCAIGLNNGQPAILLDKIKQPRAVKALLEKKFPDLKTVRWGTAAVDVDTDPKLVTLSLNRAVPGFARRLKKSLKGTGFTKVEVRSDDGGVESVGEEDGDEAEQADVTRAASMDDGEVVTSEPAEAEEEEMASASADTTPEDDLAINAPPVNDDEVTSASGNAAPSGSPAPEQKAEQAPELDAAELTQRLTDLVKRMIPVIQADPSRQDDLRSFATMAQASLKGGDLERATDLIDQLESALDSEGRSGPGRASSGVSQPAADPAGEAALAAAPQLWQDTIAGISVDFDQLKNAIRQDFASESSEVQQDIESNIARLDQIVQRLDGQLSSVLQSAQNSADQAERRNQLGKARRLLAEHIKFVASDPLIALLDENPFMQINLKQKLATCMTQVAAACRA